MPSPLDTLALPAPTPSTEAVAESNAALIAAAADGDRAAAGEYFAQNLRMLTAMARRIAGNVMDADDLLSEAIVSVLALWVRGTGPRTHLAAYLARAMRNRVTDELRSPRSRTWNLDSSWERAADNDPRLTEIDLERDVAAVHEILSLLPDDQRIVLTAMHIEGAKPRDLEVRLDRPASAISSLAQRAKANFRRLLEERESAVAARHAICA
ncbi:RNA polymerase sigma factor [Microbacterium sp. NPDC057944]|uniref:RNA polymerase sigma factor n=1 Tax=Microbacterium sp. NPDC057944 TaxID=3346286 RepID=UPI0036D76949